MKQIPSHSCQSCGKAYETIFCQLADDDFRLFSESRQVRFYKNREIVFDEGSKAQGVFCIKEGKIKIYKNGIDGTEHITRIAMQRELMGIKAILSGHPYSVSAATIEDSVICTIPKNVFFQLTLRSPEFNQAIIVFLSNLLENAETRMLSLAHKHVKQRLAEALLFLAQSFNPVTFPNSKLYLNITRHDLANLIGTSTETLIRTLSEMKDAGIIAVKGRKIFILDHLQLNKIAAFTH
jgi:CRP/FNR family transcriptional regulator, polysaccharide utilization system transcription regulator